MFMMDDEDICEDGEAFFGRAFAAISMPGREFICFVEKENVRPTKTRTSMVRYGRFDDCGCGGGGGPDGKIVTVWLLSRIDNIFITTTVLQVGYRCIHNPPSNHQQPTKPKTIIAKIIDSVVVDQVSHSACTHVLHHASFRLASDITDEGT